MRAIAVSGGLVAGLIVGVPAAAAEPVCTSEISPKIAKRLSGEIRSALRGRSGTISVALYDRERHLSCWVGASRRYDSASTVKVTIVAALLRSAQKRGLTAREKSLARAAITRSDNNATSALWSQLGRARIQRLLDLAGMKSTRLGPGGLWGLTQITAHDELRLLMLLTRKDTAKYKEKVLTARSRRYLLGLMHSVTPSQRWGTPAGVPKGVSVHVKNGWLPRRTHGWRVHSLGTFDGRKRDYMLVVLTHGNSSMSYGIRSIERVAHAAHSALNPETSARFLRSPVEEISDGSAPFEPVDGW
ncbi:serine hydrolase [Actinocorallia longicatena]